MALFSGSSSRQRSSSERYGIDYGYQGSQSYLDPRQAQAQQRFQGRFFSPGTFGNLSATPGLEGARQQITNDFQGVQNRAFDYGNNLRSMSRGGMDRFQQFTQQQNPFINQQIAGLAQDFGQLYNEQILPGIGNQAQLAGQRGSSRQGIAEALGAQRVAQEFGQAATNLRAGAYGQQQQAAQQYAAMAQAGAMNAYGVANQASAGQAQMQNAFNQTRLAGAAQPFIIGSQVIGAPSVLSQSYGENFGYDYSKSKSSGKSASVGFGSIG